ncbi:hypothetical protein SPRG_13228 [Saprolegnia parasitica CBS 223.65]|uniref:Elicitin n=1 Tax=Saprolegnia parasitica (strain CBS 223.65) TaxID=695850 RepID=A0A067BUK7_SAPPC|nr:hypothetical protein SPRG_13228 [Saprolegnia parasitica CBS 223.65]KDO20530.1 hypothetical protein SPRG_13228 [Saprolegnia parasitica CBS 223.65]|eukprot:XP_012208726.1 hypothetical protein SPRG_13228 [Saprolegnia parasitica CBS 223.65]
MLTIVRALLLMTVAVAATPCTSTQKDQMLSTITNDAQWAACQKATAPYDFYKSLTQVSPAPTSAQMQLFASTPACAAVYADFQASLKAANCDEIKAMIGLEYAPFVQLTSPPTDTTVAPAPATPMSKAVATPSAPTSMPAPTMATSAASAVAVTLAATAVGFAVCL